MIEEGVQELQDLQEFRSARRRVRRFEKNYDSANLAVQRSLPLGQGAICKEGGTFQVPWKVQNGVRLLSTGGLILRNLHMKDIAKY
jgi:hypothetical protein